MSRPAPYYIANHKSFSMAMQTKLVTTISASLFSMPQTTTTLVS